MLFAVFILVAAAVIGLVAYAISRAVRGPADKQEPPEGGGLAT